MRVLPFLALIACNPPPTNLGDAQTLTTTTLEAHLGARVSVTGTPTPTRVVEHGPPEHTCRLFYLLGNRKLFVDDCSGSNCAGSDPRCSGSDPRCAELVEAQHEPVEGTPDSRVPELVEGTPSFTGRLMLFSTLPQATELSAYFRDHFGIKVVPGTTYVILTDS